MEHVVVSAILQYRQPRSASKITSGEQPWLSCSRQKCDESTGWRCGAAYMQKHSLAAMGDTLLVIVKGKSTAADAPELE